MSEHPKRRVLEQYSVADLAPEEHARAEAHILACAACEATLRELAGAKAKLAEELPAAWFIAQVQRRAASQRRKTGFIAAGAILAAAALLLLVRPDDTLRTKGGGINLYRREGNATHLLLAGERVAAGDALQATLTSSSPVSVRAWFVDAADHIDAMTAEGPVELAAGEQPLPTSAVVEAPCKDLVLIVAKSATSPTEPELRAIAKEARAGRPSPKDVWSRALRCR